MRAFVTGGSGFIGRHLIRMLASAGWAVRGHARPRRSGLLRHRRPPGELRSFFTELMRTQGVDPGDRSVPRALAMGMARLLELPWRLLPLRSAPPDHLRLVIESLGQQSTVSDAKARRELGYVGHVSVEGGLAEMRAPL